MMIRESCMQGDRKTGFISLSVRVKWKKNPTFLTTSFEDYKHESKIVPTIEQGL